MPFADVALFEPTVIVNVSGRATYSGTSDAGGFYVSTAVRQIIRRLPKWIIPRTVLWPVQPSTI